MNAILSFDLWLLYNTSVICSSLNWVTPQMLNVPFPEKKTAVTSDPFLPAITGQYTPHYCKALTIQKIYPFLFEYIAGKITYSMVSFMFVSCSYNWNGCQTSPSGQTGLCVQMQSACLSRSLQLKRWTCQRWRLPFRNDLCRAQGQPTTLALKHAVRDSFWAPSQSDGRRERLLLHKSGNLLPNILRLYSFCIT